VLVTGATGQVGAEVASALAGRAHVTALGREALDLSQPDAIVRSVREASPQVIVNAGAYTAVDRAENEPELAHTVNSVAPGILAGEARRASALLIHFSTDYVFDGTKRTPYVEEDATNPLSVYGASKLEGERAVLASGANALVLRTAWVYGPRGKNFMLTMLRLAAKGGELRVVDDQRGAPTSSLQLARLVASLLGGGREGPIEAASIATLAESRGLYHASASGETTWHGFATAIFAEEAKIDAAFKSPVVKAITTAEYPTPAKRPAYSVLSNAKLTSTFGARVGDWRAGLSEVMQARAR
jgi:dTDP-4-dehydrorhamnose reductase